MALVLGSAMVLLLGSQSVAAADQPVPTVTPSTNYAGYSATGQRFTAVVAEFTVPDLHCNGSPSAAGFWVGLGAAGGRALEQVGVTSNCGQGYVNVQSGFYETIGGGRDSGPQLLNPIQYPVRGGDLLHVEVSFTEPNSFTYTLQNYAGWWTFSTTVQQSDMAGALDSADFVAETPGNAPALTRFDSVHFEGCFVDTSTQLTDVASLVRWEMRGGSNGPIRAEAGELSPYGGHGPNFDVSWKAS